MGYAHSVFPMATCPQCGVPLKDESARFCAACGAKITQSAPADGAAMGADPLIGKVMGGRFRLVSVLGSGGMGKVYLAEQKMGASIRKVAVKTLHAHVVASQPEIGARFQRECDTINQLTHPNTITLYDFGEDQGILYIAMEYLQGESVGQALVRDGPFEPQRVERILLQVCGSLHEAHEHGIVHRDLKPDNVLLTARGGAHDFVKVLDFGIAKRNEGDDPEVSQRLTRQGTVLGTPPYMSPEQFTGQPLDRRSDLYSLGIMAYEMLTGKLPFDAKTPWEWASKHLTQQPHPIDLHDMGKRLLDRHKRAIMKALSKSREQRHATALEFVQEFSDVADPVAAWASVSTPAPITASGVPAAARTPSRPFPQTSYQAPNPSVPTPLTAGGAMVTPPPLPLAAAPQGGHGKVVLLFIVLALLVIGGGSAGAWLALRPDTNPQPGPAALYPQPSVPPFPAVQSPNPQIPVIEPPAKRVPDEVVIEPLPPTNHPTGPNPPTVSGPVLRPFPNGNQGPEIAPPPPPPPTHRPTKTVQTINPADLQRGRQIATSGVSAARLGNFDAALSALREAQRLAGRREHTVTVLRQLVTNVGAGRVGLLLQQGRCVDAQMLFTRLRSAGADDLARRHFTPRCPAR